MNCVGGNTTECQREDKNDPGLFGVRVRCFEPAIAAAAPARGKKVRSAPLTEPRSPGDRWKGDVCMKTRVLVFAVGAVMLCAVPAAVVYVGAAAVPAPEVWGGGHCSNCGVTDCDGLTPGVADGTHGYNSAGCPIFWATGCNDSCTSVNACLECGPSSATVCVWLSTKTGNGCKNQSPGNCGKGKYGDCYTSGSSCFCRNGTGAEFDCASPGAQCEPIDS